MGFQCFLPVGKRVAFRLFMRFARWFPSASVPFKKALRKETMSVILPGETTLLIKHMIKRRNEGEKAL